MHALVVDDSRTIRRIIGDMMRTLGFEVSEAGDGVEALERLAEIETPDILLVDWNMPRMNGIDFIRTVRADIKYSDVAIMMVTTETEMERMAEAFVAGANEYVMKPFDKATIADKLHILGVGV
ncbi:response regulator [Rhodopirellula europaea]|uniref:Response regulator receiver protein n=1 Tax=Rhodopirellula europaea 6C TaxID=1263867 RepID=M2ADJ9_9BACT|nr:response regulator [Rhodopirellula europaea]EMB15165.1 response regulator receiver protein [Rhodopirellula europaea 6C]